jgi:hypothetical protein
MQPEKINFILEQILKIELDENVKVLDMIDEDYMPHIIETIHYIIDNI